MHTLRSHFFRKLGSLGEMQNEPYKCEKHARLFLLLLHLQIGFLPQISYL
jgi:hypothetical protein